MLTVRKFADQRVQVGSVKLISSLVLFEELAVNLRLDIHGSVEFDHA